MKLKIVSLVLAATLAFAMAPAHAGEDDSEGGGPSSQGTENGQGHIKYTDGTLKGKGLGHGKNHCVSCS